MALIELAGIEKTYTVHGRSGGLRGLVKGVFARETQRVRALEGISFALERGELVGYIGPNGAGKSTTVKIMSGILKPDAGTCVVDGLTPWKQRVRHVRRIGVVFGQRSQLWWDNPVRDSFELLRDIYGVRPGDYAVRVKRLCAELDAENLLATPVRQLSLGQRMRCELIAALLHAPEILFLDEPTIGLDAVSKRALRNFLTRKRREGVTMILTTHDMDDIEALCSRVMVLGHGRLLYDGGMSGLRERYAPLHRMRAALRRPAPPLVIEGTETLGQDEESVTLAFDPGKMPAQRLLAELSSKCELGGFTVRESDIEEVIETLYKELRL